MFTYLFVFIYIDSPFAVDNILSKPLSDLVDLRISQCFAPLGRVACARPFQLLGENPRWDNVGSVRNQP